MDDELRERRVEPAVGIGQVLGGREPDVDAGMPLARGGDERLGRVDRGDGVGAEPLDQHGRQRPRAAADVDRLLTGLIPARSASCAES